MTNSGVVSPSCIVRDAVRALETSRLTIAVVVDEEQRLLGAVTDGDIRRAILAGAELESPIVAVMNRTPLVGRFGDSKSDLRRLLQDNNIEAVPIVDSRGHFCKVVHISDLDVTATDATSSDYGAAVIMAGGEGKRLMPLTRDTPKPMIEIGGVPVLERTIRTLIKAGIRKIFIATNYLGDKIVSYFGDGERLGASIDYLSEKMKLGTAGGLSLIREVPAKPILVMNGDILTSIDFKNMMVFHKQQEADVTVSVVRHDVTIPYGVLDVDGENVVSLLEKPSQQFLCNAGIYVLSPDLVESIPEDRYLDMTDLIRDCIGGTRKVCAFPIHEYWTDIGNFSDLANARQRIEEAW